MYKTCLCIAVTLIAGCERNGLSPIEIKIDEDMGYTSVGDVALAATHTVSDGETLFDIAYKYNVDPMNLAKINGVRSPYNVRSGQTLRLPTENFPETAAEAIYSENKLSQYNQPLKEEKPQKNELEEEFAEVIATKSKESPTKKAASKTLPTKGNSFNEQESILSSPKVTKTAVGKSVENPKDNIPKTPEKKSPTVAAGKMIYPTKGSVISGFGDIKDGISNDGINIKAPLGAPVKAASSGEVIYAGNKLEEFGNTIIVQHDNGLITSYAHLKDIKVKNGAKINAGDIVGSVGKTGDVTEPQLHFEVLKNKTPVDPAKYLSK
ncbi:MAG: M23 family metallopeptidase [Holosporaceae bacterium]|jgi:murein DD-endopeptidase MepM/ murein hydrolase activator NlpD|nr:M23 family metallopeptidase [Holosporaceae bacterium]